jgi:hypothetical protein
LRRSFTVPLALALVAQATTAAPQADLVFADGVLGHEIVYGVQGEPLQVFGVAPALTEGPTSLLIFDPGDPRELDVGLELLPFWGLGLLDVKGHGTLSYPLPRDAALAGVALYAQGITAPGVTTLVDEITNQVKVTLSLEGECHATFGPPHVERRHHTATTLLGGRILVAGGLDPSTLVVHPNAELYDPQTGEFGPSFALPETRALHTSTLLPDGRVLLLGGVGAGGAPLASGTVYDPPSGTFTPVPPMASARVLHSATLLQDGRVFVAGGSAGFTLGHPVGYPASLATAASTTTQIYDPVTNAWTPGPVLGTGRTAHQATLLSGGGVLLSGGFVFAGPGGPHTTATCRVYDPALNAIVPTAPLPAPLCFHSAVRLDDGRVLAAGGGVADLGAVSFAESVATYIYDPDPAANATWSSGPLVPGVVGPDGSTTCTRRTVIIIFPHTVAFTIVYGVYPGAGDIDLATGTAQVSDDIYVIDPQISTCSVGGTLQHARQQPRVGVELGGIRALLTGTQERPGGPSAELWTVDY